MPRSSVDEVEQRVDEALRTARADFSCALLNQPDDASFSFLGTELCVDQVREIAISGGDPDEWATRNGKRYVSTVAWTGPSLLRLAVGRDRSMFPDSFAQFLADLCVGRPQWPAGESITASFVNLAVAEPLARPEHELPILVTVAHKLAEGTTSDNLHDVLPDLLTCYDVIHDEIPPGAPRADGLLPGASAVWSDTMPEYQMRLLSDVLPQSKNAIAAVSTNAERVELFVSYDKELRQYVRNHLYGKVADLTA